MRGKQRHATALNHPGTNRILRSLVHYPPEWFVAPQPPVFTSEQHPGRVR